MSDLIERQAAIDAINKAFERVFVWDETSPLGVKVLENVPSAQPERKNGKWIVSHIPDSMLWECNQCGFDCGAHSFNFCPNCGADMRGEQDE